ncbi:MAG TPA: hypothetical protein VGF69_13175 [Thermoanaerobaculia bacterium]|jgi:hypothetical protein
MTREIIATILSTIGVIAVAALSGWLIVLRRHLAQLKTAHLALTEQLRARVEAAYHDGFQDAQLRSIHVTKDELAAQRAAEASVAFEQGKVAGYQEVFEDFWVQIDPIVSVEKHDYLFFNTHTADIGYRVQMMYKDIPCFSPMEVILERNREVHGNAEALALAAQAVDKIASSARTLKVVKALG